MSTFAYVVLFSVIGGVLSLLLATILVSKKSIAHKLPYYATPFAAGALLSAVFLDLLTEGVAEDADGQVLIAALIGILLFYFAERFLHWFHHHHRDGDEGADPTVTLVVAGDTMHNALDGIAIAAAFLISIPTGIVTTIAVAAHEIPQEIGDFGLLLQKGVRRRKVILLNIVSSLATVVTAIGVYALGDAQALPFGVLLGLSAGFLLYIALSDIVPSLHEGPRAGRLFDWQPVMLVLGVIIVAISIQLAHDYIDVGHDREEASSTAVQEIHEEHTH